MERTTLILAAGSSSRMGTSGDKLLEKINNTPLLAIITQRTMAASDRVYVCLPGPSHPRAQLVQPEQAIWVSEAHEGMGATIRTGIGALPEGAPGGRRRSRPGEEAAPPAAPRRGDAVDAGS